MHKFKRVLAIGVIVIMMVTLLAGCDGGREVYKDIDDSDVGRFREVYYQKVPGGNFMYIYADSETGVMYVFVKDGYGGGLTVMVDENGKPLLWDDWKGATNERE